MFLYKKLDFFKILFFLIHYIKNIFMKKISILSFFALFFTGIIWLYGKYFDKSIMPTASYLIKFHISIAMILCYILSYKKDVKGFFSKYSIWLLVLSGCFILTWRFNKSVKEVFIIIHSIIGFFAFFLFLKYSLKKK